jgi:hypothetical protein
MFDVDRLVSLSRPIEVSDIDWDEARRVGISDEDEVILRYFQDTEAHTILYLKDLLSGHTARDPEVTTFLCVWVYEEMHHGRALDRFLVEVGRAPSSERHEAIHVRKSLREIGTGLFGRLAAHATPHFAAVHMAWGAANELIAATSYAQLARRTPNRQLQKLLLRLAKDERRHFAFYFDQAERRLRRGGPLVQRACAAIMKRFWKPAGAQVAGEAALDLFASYLYSDRRGLRDAALFDETVASLPGLGFFRLGQQWVEDGGARFQASHPEAYARHRAADALLDEAPEPAAVEAS